MGSVEVRVQAASPTDIASCHACLHVLPEIGFHESFHAKFLWVECELPIGFLCTSISVIDLPYVCLERPLCFTMTVLQGSAMLAGPGRWRCLLAHHRVAP